ncbi:Elongation factor Ts, mitochondrial [Rhizophlyctis rosea]|nr:Elongation factor Ts, mitochondrial [Rhizophlyctis rosea]
MRPRLPPTLRSRLPKTTFQPRCQHAPLLIRTFTSTTPSLASPTTQLVARLRKATGCSISKAREAIKAGEQAQGSTEELYKSALKWLDADAAASASKKAGKLASRTAKEGLIAVTHLSTTPQTPISASIIELNSETDFVSRSPDFTSLAERIGITAAILSDDLSSSTATDALTSQSPESLLAAPLLPHPSAPAEGEESYQSVQERITETIGKLGENIQLRRVMTVGGREDQIVGTYVHGDSSLPKNLGRIGALLVIRVRPISLLSSSSTPTLSTLARQLAQQVVGFSPLSITPSSLPPSALPEEGESESDFLDRVVLLRQPFLAGGGTVGEVVKKVGEDVGGHVEVVGFVRYECGEGIEKKEDNFAEEVLKQAGLV